jgi:hypothetical protein
MFVMRLSHSGKAFHVAFGTQAQEAFLEGHVLAFEYFGGIPGRVRYDNLKPVVVRVLKGRDRTESEGFTALRSHYGFDSFCRPGVEGAYEKGGVEGESGRLRRRDLVPVPKRMVDDLGAAPSQLARAYPRCRCARKPRTNSEAPVGSRPAGSSGRTRRASATNLSNPVYNGLLIRRIIKPSHCGVAAARWACATRSPACRPC